MTSMQRATLMLVPVVGSMVIRGLARTMRIRTLHAERVDAFSQHGHNVIIAFWHGRQLMMPLAYRGKQLAVLISAHRDGELIHRILRRFGFTSIRGSSTRGGSKALRQMVRAAKAGLDFAVTPDGPKGPRCIAQAGVVELAKLTGLPIVPLSFAASKKNSSAAGIASKFRCRLVAPASYGANRSGCRRMLIARNWKPSGWKCSKP